MVERSAPNSSQIFYVSVGRVRDQTILATCKTTNQIPGEADQDIRDHCMTLLCRQNTHITGIGHRAKSEHLGFSWHQYSDRNMISYIIVTHVAFPDEYATNFMKGMSNMLYERCPEFKKNPQGIAELNTMARHVITELQATFDGTARFGKADLEVGDGKAAGIQKTLDNVTGKMRSNLAKVFENQNELDSMEDRSGTIRSTAEKF